MNVMIALIVFFLIGILILSFKSRLSMWYDEVVHHETVVTTTVHHHDPVPEYIIEGTLTRMFENGQPYVVDPVDGGRCWLNDKDDMYEDADGKVWRLV